MDMYHKRKMRSEKKLQTENEKGVLKIPLSEIEYIQILWDFMNLNQKLEKVDCMIVLGCSDINVANVAIDLFNKGIADKIIFTGGYGKITQKIWKTPEANKFAELAKIKGIPNEKIYIENQSTNTIENFKFTKDLIEKENLNVNSAIFVCRPYVERRTWACMKKYMPKLKGIITSEKISCVDYMKNYNIEGVAKDAWINVLVGDIQRLKIYAEKGLQEKVDIPDNVWNAYNELVKRGYDKDLLK